MAIKKISDDIAPFDAGEMPVIDGSAPERVPLRGPMRESADDARARAAARMAELRGHVDGALGDDAPDRFYIDRSIVPDGWDYEWKRHTLLNKEDPAYAVALAQNGWMPVPTGRHPSMMPFGSNPDAPITRDGNMLMERPTELTQLVRKADAKRARDQVRIKEQQLTDAGPGHFDRTTPTVKKGYEAMKIPE